MLTHYVLALPDAVATVGRSIVEDPTSSWPT